MKYHKRLLLVLIITISLLPELIWGDYIKAGTVEGIRGKNYITLIFTDNPEHESYHILFNGKRLGTAIITARIEGNRSDYRYLALFRPADRESEKLLRPGLAAAVIRPDKSIDNRYEKKPYIERIEFKKEIISTVDKREMVLIPAGRFIMGSSKGDKDEGPENTEYLPDYYIDKYEVSNREFKVFLDDTAGTYPPYWEKHLDLQRNFKSPYFEDLPVIVTYYEASAYASWCGKRLPSEHEWEKAARFPLHLDRNNMDSVYTWGYELHEGISNTSELWVNEDTGKNLKELIKNKYRLEKIDKGYIPVNVYEPAALSHYGAAHMDGNALEWTDSWYKAYKNSYVKDKKYGTQYKVIRGGSYFHPFREARVTDRKTGGIPSLQSDRIAGFRCVKDVSAQDRLN